MMMNGTIKIVASLAALLLTGAVLRIAKEAPASPAATTPQAIETAVVPMHYANMAHKDRYGNIETAEPEWETDGPVVGAVVSHHIFVAEDMAKLYAHLRGQDVSTVVVIGPNHFNRGDRVMVSKLPYQTPWGVLEPNREIIQQLLTSGFATNDEKPFEIEHSISTQVGFIKAVQPSVTFVPIMLKGIVRPEDADALAEELHRILPEDAVVIASVDFSHHTTNAGAQKDDTKSIAALESFDLESVYDQHLDSPPSIYVLLRYLQLRGATRMQHKNTNSALVSGNLAGTDVTSYVFATFTR